MSGPNLTKISGGRGLKSPLQIASLAVIAFVAIVIVLRILVIRIEPGEAGVLTRPWTSGLSEEDYEPGYHFDVGPFHEWVTFDTTVQTLQMKRRSRNDQEDKWVGPLKVKSSEGATVTLDLSIKYRIKPGEAWRIATKFGPGQTLDSGYKRRFASVAQRVLVESLGTIDTEDFYDPSSRIQTRELMENALRTAAAEDHIELIAILTRDMKFDEGFEQRIREQALAEEQAALNIEETKAEQAKGRTVKIRSETDARVVVIEQTREKEIAVRRAANDREIAKIRADYEKAVTQIESDANLYQAQKKAEGDLLVKEATATGEKLKSQALQGAGGQNVVALKLAENLNLGEMTISTQAINPLDVQAILQLLGAQEVPTKKN